MAKELTSQDMGNYGLIVSMVSILILFIGMDFYTFTQRELSRKVSIHFTLKNHAALTFLLYIMVFPVIYILIGFELIPSEYALLFTAILILEHFSQELFRILIFYERQLFVSGLLFLRTGFWSILYVCFAYFDSSLNHLNYVLYAWIIGTSLSIVIPLMRFKNYPVGPSKFDFKWIVKGIKRSSILMLSGIFFKALFVVDRFSLNYIAEVKYVGVYVFYMGIALGTISFLEPMVFSYSYQKLLKTSNANNYDQYRDILKRFVTSTLVVSFILLLTVNILFPYVVDYTSNADYIAFVDYFYIISGTMFFYSLSLMCHYILYSLNLDKLILLSHSSSLAVYLFSYIIFEFLINRYFPQTIDSLAVVTLSLLFSFIWMFFTSSIFIYNKRKLFMS